MILSTHKRPRWAILLAAGDGGDTTLGRIMARLEPRLRRAFEGAVDRVSGKIDLEALAQAIRSGQITQIEVQGRLADLPPELQEIKPVLLQGFLVGAEFGSGVIEAGVGVSIAFDLVNPAAVAWAREESSQLITSIADGTRDAVRQLVERAFTEGRDPHETARAIQDVIGLRPDQEQAIDNFRTRLEDRGLDQDVIDGKVGRYADEQLRWRSNTIARTEMMGASNNGQQALYDEALRQGVISAQRTTRVWIVTPDEKLCDICAPMEDVAVALDEPWETDDGPCQVPTDSHPNCRCTFGLDFSSEDQSGDQSGDASA